MERTEELFISSDERKADEALKIVDEFINEQGLDKKKAIHLRLLAEETIGMVSAMTRDFDARFWIEHEADEYRVKLQVDTIMDKAKKEALLSVSTKGQNVLAKGFMGKIGDIIENSLLSFDESMKLQQEYGVAIPYDFTGMGVMNDMSTVGMPMVWTLSNYKESLQEASGEDEQVRDMYDELEKSIVASLARDVIVGVKRDRVEMTIVC
ncbi:hypothetical protein [Oribacterium sp. WCC10]|uniref:hypothetical protein n=1 Tax=Oribacterium sp. WCC10 TaxID=1855343 RepID=UPI0008EECE52|nr:hypothetical protein [Oribacterium sp. WCC10]SFG13861.1 hypothetical protein SAMN05216356_10290 [Oribacterium sp. WCC10]